MFGPQEEGIKYRTTSILRRVKTESVTTIIARTTSYSPTRHLGTVEHENDFDLSPALIPVAPTCNRHWQCYRQKGRRRRTKEPLLVWSLFMFVWASLSYPSLTLNVADRTSQTVRSIASRRLFAHLFHSSLCLDKKNDRHVMDRCRTIERRNFLTWPFSLSSASSVVAVYLSLLCCFSQAKSKEEKSCLVKKCLCDKHTGSCPYWPLVTYCRSVCVCVWVYAWLWGLSRFLPLSSLLKISKRQLQCLPLCTNFFAAISYCTGSLLWDLNFKKENIIKWSERKTTR